MTKLFARRLVSASSFGRFVGKTAAFAIAVLGLTGALGFPWLPSTVSAAEQYEVWPGLKKDVFGDRAIAEETGAITLEAPYRADDAALVPLTMRIPANLAATARKLTLIVDQNPAPVAATFTFGKAAGSSERMISTRVRIDMYSNVRAVLETDDGQLHMTTKFVKASGGCSAPAGKDIEEALANLGKMQIRVFDAAEAAATREAQVMIRHPNYTGMQMDQATRNFTPAKFVTEMTVTSGDELVFRMDGGISVSENPNFRFSYSGGTGTIEVTAKDTDGKTFTARRDPKGS
ncbi:MAG: quinoprotein dehydrogenase-associated SoxYZ-like carrier [Hyphomicrobium sp.]